MERRRQQEELFRLYEGGLITPGEIWGALKGWEGARSGAEYANLDGSGNLEVVQTGYTYIFQIPNILRPEDRKEEEQRIKAGLAAGVLMIDGSTRLVDVKPRLEVLRKA